MLKLIKGITATALGGYVLIRNFKIQPKIVELRDHTIKLPDTSRTGIRTFYNIENKNCCLFNFYTYIDYMPFLKYQAGGVRVRHFDWRRVQIRHTDLENTAREY